VVLFPLIVETSLSSVFYCPSMDDRGGVRCRRRDHRLVASRGAAARPLLIACAP
jgi:hypothetical protein